MNFEINWGNIEWGGIMLMYFMYYLIVVTQYIRVRRMLKIKKESGEVISVLPNILKKGKQYVISFSMFKFTFLFLLMSLIVFLVTLYEIGKNIKASA